MAYAALETPSGLCYIRDPVAYAYIRSKAVIILISGVVHSMFIVSSIVCVFMCMVLVYFCYAVLYVLSRFAISFHRTRESLALL